MPNKKINQLDVKVAVSTDLVLVGDPATGTSYKSTVATLPLVPYTGASGNVNLGEHGLTAGQLTLDTTPTGTAAVGTTRWNDTIGSSETTLKGGSVILKNGVDLVARVVNKVSPNTTLTKASYQAVRVSGAQGQRLAVALAQANNDANSADTIGLVIETIATNQEGFIMTVGQLENINTTGSLQGETWADGDVLYLSPTTAGAITKVKPTGNGHIVVIGYVEYAHQNNGKIYVKVMNGWELDELHDVSIVSPANNEALIYESATSLWKNKTIATALGYTPISGSGASGQVAYWNGTSSQTGSNNLTWDNINGRLGINKVPTNSLDLLGTLRVNNSSGYGLLVNSSGQAAITTAGGATGLSVSDTSNAIMQMSGGAYSYRFVLLGSAQRLEIRDVNQSDAVRFAISNAGNTMLNTTTDGGQRLQVMGDAFIKGSGATSATNALLVQNSAGTTILQVRNDNYVLATNISTTSVFSTNYYPSGTGATMNLYGGSSGTTSSFVFNTYGSTDSALSNDFVRMSRVYNPTSGAGVYNTLLIGSTINQTGGANGVTRGLYIQPTLTAAADWRSIEWSNNSGWGLYGAGTANNYLGGNLGIGSASLSNANLAIEKNISGSTSAYGVLLNSVIQSGVTANAYGFRSLLTTQAASFTLSNIYHFVASQTTQGAGSIVLNQIGFECGDMNNAYTNIAYRGQISQGTLQWNLYMNGTASNYLAGQLLIGTTTKGTFALDVNGTARVSGNTTISLNQNAETSLTIANTNSGSSSVSVMYINSDAAAGSFQFGKYSTNRAVYKIFNPKDAFIYNGTAGDISILNEVGAIKFAAGGSSTAHMTIKSNGRINMSSLPTSSAGLSTGDLWNNLGILSIA